MTSLASSLGMVTTAEGVERSDQLSQLKLEGCVQVQGYLFSKAMPAASVIGRVVPETGQNLLISELGQQDATAESGVTQLRLAGKRTG